MREGLFIKKGKDRWEQIEYGKEGSADETASNFTRLINDLGYAKTFYPTSKTTTYLNSLASRIYLGIYQKRKDPTNRLVQFFKYDVPQTMYKHRLIMLFALSVFAVFFTIGFFSSIQDPGFIREVLGDSYVDMTEKNIEQGNPFNVYANTSSFLMWIYIMLNNITVSITYFFRGLLLGIPSITALGKESIRIGAFEYMFYAKGLGSQAVVTILLHGILELTAIIITCGAGAVLGTSFLFPKTGTRLAAFQQGAKDGVKIVIALIPVFIVAAFIEGYITRHYKMPLAMSLSILILTGSFIVWYFILYPFLQHRRVSQTLSVDHA
ncbi:MAG: rane protein [Flaviaesturariibacter sp.]|nr:rane protein [Flaviaesturariibacter sp.]